MTRPVLLIVDDDAEIREQLKWALASEYEVLEAEDRATTLELVNTRHPQLVTLDLGLPGDVDGASEGLSALGDILTTDPLTRVIVMTGNSDRTNALKAVQLGAFDYIQKPVQLDVLKVVLQRAAYLQRLDRENQSLQREQPTDGLGDILGRSPAMQRVFSVIRRVAPADVPVLITGESGTGKGLVARAIHRLSGRHQAPFVSINCGAIPENLLESELFGHEKGAFTGAHIQRRGRIESAEHGVLFLDEIGEMPLPLQVKLLHVLQEQRIVRVGGREEIPVDARVIAATNRDLSQAIQQGTFREDLFYRLQVVTIAVPPLRDRGEDVRVLAQALLQQAATEQKKKLLGFTPAALKAIEAYNWPGNVRELENRIKRAVVMAEGQRITHEDLELNGLTGKSHKLKDARESIEKECIQKTLAKNRGNISKTAAELGVSRPTLHGLISKYSIER
ncbi:PEP-CTERM-box response regulator transcription factor [Candidatus Nitrospira bockiana]